jgi:release factor glutamine methyltransferase
LSDPTRRVLLDEARRALEGQGVDNAALDARVLLKAALLIGDAALITGGGERVDPDAAARYRALIARRASGEPVARLLGTREFWGMDFTLSADTLVPRADTETVVEAALAAAAKRRGEPLRVLDLGTGTGCILIALLRELPKASGLGVDIADGALDTARGNAERLGVAARTEFANSYWTDAVTGRFDLVVSNPPYIGTGEIAGLDREVREHDPMRALIAGADGLDAYREIARRAASVLEPGGALVLELGQGQEDAVAALLRDAGLRIRDRARADLGGIARAITAYL